MVRYSCRMTYFHNTTGNKSQLGLNLTWISLDVIENKTRNKENKTFLNYYPGAFEQAVCLGHGAFASEFSKNPNSWGSVWGGGGGGVGYCWNWLMHYCGNTKRFIPTHVTFRSCHVSLRLENSTTLIGIAVLAGTSVRHAIYPGVIALIISFLYSCQDTRNAQILESSKQASEKERSSIKQEVEVDTNIIHEKAQLNGYHIHLHIGHFFQR